MVKVIDLCTSCVQIITNPICPYCFSRQVIMWLRDKNIEPQKMKKIQKLLKTLVQEAEITPSDTRCIICGADRVNLCAYCFTSKASNILEKNTDKKITDEFKEDFNTEIWQI